MLVTSHPGQLSLAVLLWVGSMSTSVSWISWSVNRYAMRCTSHVFLVSQGKTGVSLEGSAPFYGPCGFGRTLC